MLTRVTTDEPGVTKAMLSGFLTTLGAFAANKKIVGAWLILLSLATAEIGDKVYVRGGEEMAILKTRLEEMQKTLDKIDKMQDVNNTLLQQLLVEQTRVATELAAHEKMAYKP